MKNLYFFSYFLFPKKIDFKARQEINDEYFHVIIHFFFLLLLSFYFLHFLEHLFSFRNFSTIFIYFLFFTLDQNTNVITRRLFFVLWMCKINLNWNIKILVLIRLIKYGSFGTILEFNFNFLIPFMPRKSSSIRWSSTMNVP